MTQTTVQNIIALAAEHAAKMPADRMVSSAMFCIDEARSLAVRGEWRYAAARAVESLRYSIGILHADFAGAAAAAKEVL